MTASVRGLESLGRTQVLVLQLLAGGAKSVRELAYHWPSLTESSARSALERLGDKRLVDVAGFESGTTRRQFCLTARGADVERRLLGEPGEGS